MIELFFKDFLELFWQNPVGQAFGFLGMGIGLYGFMQSDDTKTKKIVCYSSIAWISHFFFMGFISAGISAFIGLVRLILSLKFRKNIYIFFSVVTVSAVFGFLSYENKIGVLPIVGSILGTINFFFLEKLTFRIMAVFISLIYLYYSVNVGSLGGMINEVLLEFLLIVVIIKMAGKEGHIHHYREKISSILHKNQDVDMGELTVLKDTQKIIKKHGYFHKTKNYIKESLKKAKKIKFRFEK